MKRPFILRLGFLLLLCACGGAQAQPDMSVSPNGIRRFPAGETGSVTQLGVRLQVQPISRSADTISYVVSTLYQNPTDPQNTEEMRKTILEGSCRATQEPRKLLEHGFVNSRGTRFKLIFIHRCKQAGQQWIPYLDTQFWCSRVTFETAYIKAAATGQLFQIIPAFRPASTAPSDLSGLVDIVEQGYNIVSWVSTIVDFVYLTHGAITFGRFLMQSAVGYVKDQIVGAAFKYAKSELGYQASFVAPDGWRITCRVCGSQFSRVTLIEGEILECPNKQCRSRVALHFH